MSSTKTSTGTTTTQNQFQRLPGASSPDIDTLRGTQFKVDPTIGFRQAAGKRQLERTLNSPTGGYRTAAMRDALQLEGERELGQQAGMESRAGQYDVNNQTYGKNLAVAGLTAPPLVQSGSTGTQVEKNKTPFSAKIMPSLMPRSAGGAGGLDTIASHI